VTSPGDAQSDLVGAGRHSSDLYAGPTGVVLGHAVLGLLARRTGERWPPKRTTTRAPSTTNRPRQPTTRAASLIARLPSTARTKTRRTLNPPAGVAIPTGGIRPRNAQQRAPEGPARRAGRSSRARSAPARRIVADAPALVVPAHPSLFAPSARKALRTVRPIPRLRRRAPTPPWARRTRARTRWDPVRMQTRPHRRTELRSRR
jgi:hypothetical protein